jgi:hypothetical protein
VLRFDRFELIPQTRELFRDGAPVALEPQPAALLVLLATRAGELVTHAEIVLPKSAPAPGRSRRKWLTALDEEARCSRRK